jgi:predicted Zn-dependent protease
MQTPRLLMRSTNVVILGIALILTSCAKDYVTGQRTFSLVSESQELTMGKEADEQIVAMYGVYDDPELVEYVKNIGRGLAAKSQRADIEYTFRVLDSPVVNAFAVPGYVYMTRGILAHFNSEDQLAGVLGHEIGHIVGRHSAEQVSRQQLAGLGLGLGSIFSETIRQYGDLAGFGLQLMLLKYSRSQESESDMLGVEYSTKLGYDADEMAAFFGTLKRMGEKSGQSLPTFLSTHPDPGDREERVQELATEWQQKIDYRPLATRPYDYFKRIDGIVYGEDPRQGYVDGSMFYHPALRFQFPIPGGWKVVNTPTTVILASPDEQAIIQLRLAESDSPEAAADAFVQKNQLTVRDRRTTSVNGFNAVVIQTAGQTENQQLGILSYFIAKDANIFVFHGYSDASAYAKYSGTFSSTMSGFNAVRDPKVLNKAPTRLQVKQAPKAGTLASVLEALGAKRDIHDELAVLNGLELTDQVARGEWIKVAVE